MSITQRGRSWQVSVSHQQKRIRKSFKRYEEARLFELRCTADLLAGVFTLESNTKNKIPTALGKLADRVWSLEWEKQKSSDHTFNRMLDVRSYFGDETPVEEITSQRLEEYVLHLRGLGNKPSTINRKLSIISKILTHAHRHGLIESKPVTPKQRETEGRMNYYSKEEEKKILALMEDVDLRDLFMLLIDTGFRKGEALSLKWRDVSFDREMIKLADPTQIKTGRTRSVPMTRRVEAALLSRLGRASSIDKVSVDASVFPFSSRKAEQLAEKFKERYADPLPAFFHTCRHTFCSRLVQGGVPLTSVRDLAGHHDINTTLRYAHLALKNYQDAISVLEEDE